MSNNTQAPAKKKNKAGGVFTSIVAVALIAFAGYYLLTNYVLASKHTIVINDKKIDLRSSIDDIEKQGFYPGDKLIITHETNENPLPTRLIDDIISHYLL